ncbi:MAG: hypothetical protein ACRYGM_16295 [Janthinobacterium lividum]
MRLALALLSLTLPVLALPGCAYEAKGPPVSTGMSSATQAQPANSLPRGAAVNAPVFSGGAGSVTTRVGP